MNIEPGTTIPLVYQNVAFVTDNTTYYVRAVVRDSLDGKILDIKNLIDQGNGRYTSAFLAPQDTSGEGRHIDVTITLYTDSVYIAKSPDYEERNFNYVIKASHIFGGGGTNIDYDLIATIVRKIIEEKSSLPSPTTEIKQDIALGETLLDLSPVLLSLDAFMKEVRDFKESVKPFEKTDLSPVLAAIAGIKPADKVNLEPVFEALKNLAAVLSKKIDDKEIPKTDISGVEQVIGDIKMIVTPKKEDPKHPYFAKKPILSSQYF